ncbi:uncharacterized protein LOC110465362 [Mizuhopecten yessoensis]|uniref:uncharacterized protein LOC110465362 n=1 Tax=Mizuhopecten yessoensis TaxID=6573 RepID=UPI000B459281|nr:uncharacterized protein LOC110465362 [Mizuhopecten yessoensis]XP_021376801.1 uncharacterized protein LOC110465362 [Mizuhopecten yessoensis]
MSDDVVWGGKRNKRMNVEELRTDYSGVYLQNEKLEQALNRFLEKLQKDRKHLSEQHEQELFQVKKEVDSMNVFLHTTNSLDLFSHPLTAANTIRIPVPKRPELNRDPTTFPEKWFTSVFVPTDKELIKIKRQRSTHPPLPFIRRSKTDMAKRKQKEKEEKEEEEEERSSFISKKASIEDNAKSLGINRSKTEIGHHGVAIPMFGQTPNEQRTRDTSRLSLTRSNRGGASIYAGQPRDSVASVTREQGNVLPEFMAQRKREASARSRSHSQGSSRFAQRGREPSGRSIARSLGNRDDGELRLPHVTDGGLDELLDMEAPTATVVTRSVRELKAMALSNQNNKLPSSEMLRNQRMLDSTKRKDDRILTKMRTFIKTFEEEMGEKGDDKRSKLVDFVL